MPSKYAFDPEKLDTMFKRPWELRLDARRIFGNLFFVGNADGASWLVETSAGLVLFDSNYPTASSLLLNSIWSLGFDPKDITAIFHTHGHFDHFGATDLIRHLSGAKTYLGIGDCRMFRQRPELALIESGHYAYLETFVPDVEVRDGDVFTFGDTVIRAGSCPGHSQGATSYFFNVSDGKRTQTAGLHGGAGLNTLCRSFRETYHVDWRQDFLNSIRRQINEPVDIFLGNHTEQNHFRQRAAEQDRGNPDAFVDPARWKQFLADTERKALIMIQEEASE